MKENMQKSDEKNSLRDWYNEIPRNKRNKFILALQLKFWVPVVAVVVVVIGMSASGIYDKIKKNNWLPYQREMVEEVINEGKWEK